MACSTLPAPDTKTERKGNCDKEGDMHCAIIQETKDIKGKRSRKKKPACRTDSASEERQAVSGRERGGQERSGREWTGAGWTGVDGSRVDGSGVDGSGRERGGRERSGREWTGAGWTGAEWTGVDGSRVDGSGVDGSGVDGSGVDRSGQEQGGREQGGWEQSGREWTGAGWTGAEWTGAGWTGTEWTGVDGSRVDGNRVDGSGREWTGAEWTGADGSRVDGSRVDGSRVDGSGREQGGRSGREQSGRERTGAEWTGVDGNRVDGSRQEQSGRERGGREQGGQEWTGADGSRVDGSRVDGSRVDRSRVDGCRVDRSRVDGCGEQLSAGPDRRSRTPNHRLERGHSPLPSSLAPGAPDLLPASAAPACHVVLPATPGLGPTAPRPNSWPPLTTGGPAALEWLLQSETISRSLGDMELAEEAQAAGSGPTEPEATAPEPKTAKEAEPPSPCRAEVSPPRGAAPPTPPGGSEETEGQEPDRRPQEQEEEEEAAAASPWSGPEDLELELRDGRRCVRARLSLAEGLSWGPFQGTIQTRAASPGQTEEGPALTLKLTDEARWLRTLPQALTEAEANSEIYRKDGALWCRVTKPVPAGGRLHVALMAEPLGTPGQPVKEPAEPERPAPGHADIQLLPQQAGMASILATAVINKDVFPCKDCGIWYRSERNLQAHLLYYCASRQRAASPAATASEEKPKETYPNERICPFPQCRKSCPSASSLEIHMRSHSGERPFVCLICLSAFTTKANCERHLKVHTDTLSGVCHNCGFISTTRDILYSHLVTSHMVCQPGSKGEIYSPGAKLPADGLAGFQQPSALQGPLVSATTPSPGPDRKAPAAATNGEAPAAPQNGGGSEPPALILQISSDQCHCHAHVSYMLSTEPVLWPGMRLETCTY
ncbi:PREDICTED: zinc finger protein ZFPM1 [Dipodomys ordii]|uniref:Zinc finger protein ZFPM1 n=1 Tax=Dipodomys ordii TaxID=10020 RepID=A0A1S3EW51_DIPOR|nr:PREDICTED: zinc finger protein ZFPM1 [Dipodomys ordii]